MRKFLIVLVVVGMAGCGSLTGSSPITSGLLVQYHIPATVQVPAIADAGTSQTQTTHFGTHKNPPATAPASTPMMPVVPVPRIGNQPVAGPCQE